MPWSPTPTPTLVDPRMDGGERSKSPQRTLLPGLCSLGIFLPVVLLSCAQRNLHSPRFRDHKKPLQVSYCFHSIQRPWKLAFLESAAIDVAAEATMVCLLGRGPSVQASTCSTSGATATTPKMRSSSRRVNFMNIRRPWGVPPHPILRHVRVYAHASCCSCPHLRTW